MNKPDSPDDFVQYKGYTFSQVQFEHYKQSGYVVEEEVRYFDPHEAIAKARKLVAEKAAGDQALLDLLKRLFAFEDKVMDHYRLRHLK